MKLLVSAGETSSDIHGAELLKAIRNERPDLEIYAYGMGGPRLKEAGLDIKVDAKNLLVMGFSEVLGKIPEIRRSLKCLTQAAKDHPPDVAIFIDYPDFHFLLARRLKRLGVKLIYYIPPKVWAWRKRRISFLKRMFSRVLCVLPFEEEFYRTHGLKVKYVGNPLVDELPWDLTQAGARRELGLRSNDRVILGMPGSRSAELHHHFELVLDAALQVTEKFAPKMNQRNVLLIPLPETVHLSPLEKKLSIWKTLHPNCPLEIQLRVGKAHQCMVAADVGMVKSGTSTLEAGLLRCPHVLFFKPNALSAWIFRYLIRYRGPVGLVNLILGIKKSEDGVIPEILCGAVTAKSLAERVLLILEDSGVRNEMLADLNRLREKVAGFPVRLRPSENAAREVFKELGL